MPRVSVVGVDAELAVEAGEAKRRYRLALTDCYVLAAARVYGGRPVFRRVEAEMRGVVDELRRGYGVVFLEDYVWPRLLCGGWRRLFIPSLAGSMSLRFSRFSLL